MNLRPRYFTAKERSSEGNWLRILLLFLCCFAASRFVSPIHASDDDPAAELASFKLAGGFEANLFASEKDGVVKPIQIRWDTRGRLWVIQSTTYPQLKPGEEPNDKVLILEDTDGDGRADKTTVFADGLMIPTGLEIAPTPPEIEPRSSEAAKEQTEVKPPSSEGAKGEKKGKDEPLISPEQVAERLRTMPSHPNRAAPKPASSPLRSFAPSRFIPSACYVGEGTKLWLLTDTDGDGKCDRREVVLRGFGTGDNHQNINSFRWSPGGELFFSQGLHAHSRVETPHGIVALDHAGFFRFRRREQRLDAFYGGHADPQNPWGFVWTDWGQMLMVAGNNGGIYWPLPEMIRGVQNGKRDNLWVNARGRKTSGPDIVGTAHFPPEWQGAFITGGYINNAVWALDLADDGAGFKLTDRPPLLTSTHTAFRPVDVKFGPDGALYVCDWFNPIIGHYQASFRHPDRDKTHGRIWRITAKGRPLVKPPKIAGAPVEALLENLKSPERYVREQSKRELAGRPTAEVVEKARKWWPKIVEAALSRSDVPPPSAPRSASSVAGEPHDAPAAGRSEAARPVDRAASTTAEHALYEVLGVFEAHETPEPELLEKMCVSHEPNVRAHATGVVAHWADRIPRSFDLLHELAHDTTPCVRLGAIAAAGNLQNPESLVVVLHALDRGSDRFFDIAARAAVDALKPQIPALTARGLSEWTEGWKPEWKERLAALQRPPDSKKTSAPAAVPKPAALPATGQLRATPEFVAALVKEVRESGDAKRGAEVFRRAELTCTACHSIEDKGGKIGPPLDAIGSGQPLDFIIGATLEPQREIKESYEAMQMTAKHGRIAIGYIAARNAEGTALRDPASGAETRFAAAELAELKPIGSLMPAGLVDRLSREDLRDLFRYLSELGKPR